MGQHGALLGAAQLERVAVAQHLERPEQAERERARRRLVHGAVGLAPAGDELLHARRVRRVGSRTVATHGGARVAGAAARALGPAGPGPKAGTISSTPRPGQGGGRVGVVPGPAGVEVAGVGPVARRRGRRRRSPGAARARRSRRRCRGRAGRCRARPGSAPARWAGRGGRSGRRRGARPVREGVERRRRGGSGPGPGAGRGWGPGGPTRSSGPASASRRQGRRPRRPAGAGDHQQAGRHPPRSRAFTGTRKGSAPSPSKPGRRTTSGARSIGFGAPGGGRWPCHHGARRPWTAA